VAPPRRSRDGPPGQECTWQPNCTACTTLPRQVRGDLPFLAIQLHSNDARAAEKHGNEGAEQHRAAPRDRGGVRQHCELRRAAARRLPKEASRRCASPSATRTRQVVAAACRKSTPANGTRPTCGWREEPQRSRRARHTSEFTPVARRALPPRARRARRSIDADPGRFGTFGTFGTFEHSLLP